MLSKINKYTLKTLQSIKNFINNDNADTIVPDEYLLKLDQYNAKIPAASVIIEAYVQTIQSNFLNQSMLNNLLSILLLAYNNIDLDQLDNIGTIVANIYVDVLLTLIIESSKNDDVDVDSLKLFTEVVIKNFINRYDKSYDFPLAMKICPVYCPILATVKLLNRRHKHQNYSNFLQNYFQSPDENSEVNVKLQNYFKNAENIGDMPIMTKLNDSLINGTVLLMQSGGGLVQSGGAGITKLTPIALKGAAAAAGQPEYIATFSDVRLGAIGAETVSDNIILAYLDSTGAPPQVAPNLTFKTLHNGNGRLLPPYMNVLNNKNVWPDRDQDKDGKVTQISGDSIQSLNRLLKANYDEYVRRLPQWKQERERLARRLAEVEQSAEEFGAAARSAPARRNRSGAEVPASAAAASSQPFPPRVRSSPVGLRNVGFSASLSAGKTCMIEGNELKSVTDAMVRTIIDYLRYVSFSLKGNWTISDTEIPEIRKTLLKDYPQLLKYLTNYLEDGSVLVGSGPLLECQWDSKEPGLQSKYMKSQTLKDLVSISPVLMKKLNDERQAVISTPGMKVPSQALIDIFDRIGRARVVPVPDDRAGAAAAEDERKRREDEENRRRREEERRRREAAAEEERRRREIDAAAAAAEEKRRRKEEEKSHIQARIQELEDQIRELQETIRQNQSIIKELQDEIDLLSRKSQEDGDYIAELERLVEEHQTNNEGLVRQVDELLAEKKAQLRKLQECTEELARTRQQLDALQRDLDRTRQQRHDLQDEVAALKLDKFTLEETYNRTLDQIKELQTQLDEVQAELRQAEEDRKLFGDDINRLDDLIRQKDQRIAAFKAGMDRLNDELREKTRILQETQDELESLNDRYRQLAEAHNQALDLIESDRLTKERLGNELTQSQLDLNAERELNQRSEQTIELLSQQLEDQNADFLRQFEALQTELGDQIQQLKDENAGLNRILDQTIGERDELRAQIAANEDRIRALREEVIKIGDLVLDWRREYERLQAELDTANETLLEQDQNIQELEAEMQRIIDEHALEIDNLRLEHLTEMENLERQHGQDLADLTRLKDDERDARLDTMAAEYDEHIEDINQRHEARLQRLQDELNAQQDEYLQRVQELEEDCERRLADLAARYERALDELQERIRRMGINCAERIRRVIDEKDAERDELLQELRDLLDEKDQDQDNELAEAENVIRDLENENERLREENERLVNAGDDCPRDDEARELEQRRLREEEAENKRISGMSLHDYLGPANNRDPENYLNLLIAEPNFRRRLDIIKRQLKGKKEKNMTEKIINLIGGEDDTLPKYISVIVLIMITFNNFNDFMPIYYDDWKQQYLEIERPINSVNRKTLINSFTATIVNALDRNKELRDVILMINLVKNAVKLESASGPAEYKLIKEQLDLLR